MLDEQAKRKPNWCEQNSVPVVLADGQSWFLPKPWLEIQPIFRNGKAAGSCAALTYGPELDALIEAMSECEDPMTQIVAVVSLAAYLLNWHYDLADLELDQLLAFRAADLASTEWVKTVIAVATGASGPKAYRAGGG